MSREIHQLIPFQQIHQTFILILFLVTNQKVYFHIIIKIKEEKVKNKYCPHHLTETKSLLFSLPPMLFQGELQCNYTAAFSYCLVMEIIKLPGDKKKVFMQVAAGCREVCSTDEENFSFRSELFNK